MKYFAMHTPTSQFKEVFDFNGVFISDPYSRLLKQYKLALYHLTMIVHSHTLPTNKVNSCLQKFHTTEAIIQITALNNAITYCKTPKKTIFGRIKKTNFGFRKIKLTAFFDAGIFIGNAKKIMDVFENIFTYERKKRFTEGHFNELKQHLPQALVDVQADLVSDQYAWKQLLVSLNVDDGLRFKDINRVFLQCVSPPPTNSEPYKMSYDDIFSLKFITYKQNIVIHEVFIENQHMLERVESVPEFKVCKSSFFVFKGIHKEYVYVEKDGILYKTNLDNVFVDHNKTRLSLNVYYAKIIQTLHANINTARFQLSSNHYLYLLLSRKETHSSYVPQNAPDYLMKPIGYHLDVHDWIPSQWTIGNVLQSPLMNTVVPHKYFLLIKNLPFVYYLPSDVLGRYDSKHPHPMYMLPFILYSAHLFISGSVNSSDPKPIDDFKTVCKTIFMEMTPSDGKFCYQMIALQMHDIEHFNTKCTTPNTYKMYIDKIIERVMTCILYPSFSDPLLLLQVLIEVIHPQYVNKQTVRHMIQNENPLVLYQVIIEICALKLSLQKNSMAITVLKTQEDTIQRYTKYCNDVFSESIFFHSSSLKFYHALNTKINSNLEHTIDATILLKYLLHQKMTFSSSNVNKSDFITIQMEDDVLHVMNKFLLQPIENRYNLMVKHGAGIDVDGLSKQWLYQHITTEGVLKYLQSQDVQENPVKYVKGLFELLYAYNYPFFMENLVLQELVSIYNKTFHKKVQVKHEWVQPFLFNELLWTDESFESFIQNVFQCSVNTLIEYGDGDGEITNNILTSKPIAFNENDAIHNILKSYDIDFVEIRAFLKEMLLTTYVINDTSTVSSFSYMYTYIVNYHVRHLLQNEEKRSLMRLFFAHFVQYEFTIDDFMKRLTFQYSIRKHRQSVESAFRLLTPSEIRLFLIAVNGTTNLPTHITVKLHNAKSIAYHTCFSSVELPNELFLENESNKPVHNTHPIEYDNVVINDLNTMKPLTDEELDERLQELEKRIDIDEQTKSIARALLLSLSIPFTYNVAGGASDRNVTPYIPTLLRVILILHILALISFNLQQYSSIQKQHTDTTKVSLLTYKTHLLVGVVLFASYMVGLWLRSSYPQLHTFLYLCDLFGVFYILWSIMVFKSKS
jgi:hypothetical protein